MGNGESFLDIQHGWHLSIVEEKLWTETKVDSMHEESYACGL